MSQLSRVCVWQTLHVLLPSTRLSPSPSSYIPLYVPQSTFRSFLLLDKEIPASSHLPKPISILSLQAERGEVCEEMKSSEWACVSDHFTTCYIHINIIIPHPRSFYSDPRYHANLFTLRTTPQSEARLTVRGLTILKRQQTSVTYQMHFDARGWCQKLYHNADMAEENILPLHASLSNKCAAFSLRPLVERSPRPFSRRSHDLYKLSSISFISSYIIWSLIDMSPSWFFSHSSLNIVCLLASSNAYLHSSSIIIFTETAPLWYNKEQISTNLRLSLLNLDYQRQQQQLNIFKLFRHITRLLGHLI